MKRIFHRALLALAALAAFPVAASFHLFRMDEAYSSADGKVQYIEFTALAGGQQFVTGHSLRSSSGASSNLLTLPTDLPGDTTGRKFLIGSSSFAALGIVTPDYVMPDGFLFASGGTLNWGEFSDVWNHGALPADGIHSLNRDGSTGVNSPTNFAGATGQIVPPSSPDLAVAQSASPGTAGAGKDVVFDITITNNGGSDATNVTLTDTVPPGSTYVWATPGCSVSGSTVTCAIGTLGAGATAGRQFVARPFSHPMVNDVSVTLSEADGNTTNNTSSLSVGVNTLPPGVPVVRYRLYNPISQEHLYTTDQNEYNVLGAGGVWQQEGTVGQVLNNPGSFNGVTATPYYRLYNNFTLWHHWTTDANEYYTLLTFPGWGGEGVDGYLLPSNTTGATELFRLVYPDGRGLHHWTIDATEYGILINTYGWVGEGGAGFVVSP